MERLTFSLRHATEKCEKYWKKSGYVIWIITMYIFCLEDCFISVWMVLHDSKLWVMTHKYLYNFKDNRRHCDVAQLPFTFFFLFSFFFNVKHPVCCPPHCLAKNNTNRVLIKWLTAQCYSTSTIQICATHLFHEWRALGKLYLYILICATFQPSMWLKKNVLRVWRCDSSTASLCD